MALIKCPECGKEISENAVNCPNCGAKNRNNNETASTGIKVICFLIPLVGIIIFAINISTRPKYAKGCLIASLLPTIIAIIIICVVLLYTMPMSDKGLLSSYNTTSSYSTTSSYDDDDYLPYCKKSDCYNRVSYSWRKYCDKHSYLED